MVNEVVHCLHPRPGELAVDCTLGGGGHALAILECLQPGGRLIGLDVDPLELPRTADRLRERGFGPRAFVPYHANFADLPAVLAGDGVAVADVILADLGVSSMQHDTPARGFSSKTVGPLDLRMNPSRGETAAQLVARSSEEVLVSMLQENADEPQAQLIAAILTRERPPTTHALERVVRLGLNAAVPDLPNAAVKMSVRRTLQALRIAVNDEFSSLETLLQVLPQCLAPGGRVAVLTFHSGEDRRVKKAFQAGRRAGVYTEIADQVIRATKEETFANRRASSAKLRWALRALH